VAIGCVLIAVLENYQNRDEIPEALWPSALSKAKKDFQFVRQ
jgi:seryl-tRNA synthetase